MPLANILTLRRLFSAALRFLVYLSTAAALSLVAFLPEATHATPPADAPVPVLLELFTSEGCSSCPPVDQWVQQVDSLQPIPGAEIIVLSEHVDYWNHDGWKDPYSSALITGRQQSYVQNLGLKGAYTPQIILDGRSELQPGNLQQVLPAVDKLIAVPAVAIHISSLAIDSAQPSFLHGHIDIHGTPQGRGDIYVAAAIDHAKSQVLRGENEGRNLSHVAVLQELLKVGRLEKGKDLERDFQIKLKPGTDPANLRIVAFVQEPNLGRVLGAAMKKPTS